MVLSGQTKAFREAGGLRQSQGFRHSADNEVQIELVRWWISQFQHTRLPSVPGEYDLQVVDQPTSMTGIDRPSLLLPGGK